MTLMYSTIRTSLLRLLS